MSIFASMGAAVGLLIGLIICVILFRYANTDKKIKTEYDERQQIVRYRAYRLAFYTIMVFEALVCIAGIGGFELPMVSYVQHFTGVMIGATVLGVYCIWHDVYWGLNNNKTRYMLIFVFTAILNCIPIIGAAKSGNLIIDGKLGMAALNIMVIAMLIVVVVTLLIKQIADKGGKGEEE